MPDGPPAWLCLRHAGAVWNARKTANRAAGRCPCGAVPTPGYRTCQACRERGRADRQRARAFAARAAECGITLPRQASRRRAFIDVYREAFNRAQRAARRGWRRAWARGALSPVVTVRLALTWEGRPVVVEAIADSRGSRARGVRAGASKRRERRDNPVAPARNWRKLQAATRVRGRDFRQNRQRNARARARFAGGGVVGSVGGPAAVVAVVFFDEAIREAWP